MDLRNVIPAKEGIQSKQLKVKDFWIPASAGMTESCITRVIDKSILFVICASLPYFTGPPSCRK
jgi:hypothetical protein